ncbi:MAG: response regulator transcription factor [Cyclobacteriaceae bacterium]|jgi:DNA-binding NarL/FixJ family response regulator|nr:response regulator transcription factor [Cyclobacteriaceae bacterium]
MKSVLIIEDELLVAQNIEAILEDNGFIVTGIATEVTSAKNLIAHKRPDVILCDIYLKGTETGIDFAEYILNSSLDIPIVFLTAFADTHTIKRASAAQPVAYLVKPFTDKQLVATLQLVTTSEPDKNIVVPEPSPREKEILNWLAKGNTSKQIAQSLNLSEHTVQTHRKNLMNRYNTTSSTELIALAIKLKWIKLGV